MHSQGNSQFFHRQGSFLHLLRISRTFLRVGFLIIYLYSFRQIPINAPHVTLHKRGSQIRLQHAIPATFGNHPLTHVTDRIDVKMRHAPHQSIRPIQITQSSLFFGCKLQTAMCSEMNHSIRLEPVLHPQISGHVGMRRCDIRPVYNLEGIIPTSGYRLWHNDHVPKLYSRYP